MHSKAQAICGRVLFPALLLATLVEPALANGGLEKVDEFALSVETMMRAVSITVVSIAVMWAGYKFMFKSADIMEIGKILAGGMLIGGSAEIAGWLLG
jgi:type IV secretion system protein VirB2/type IV secretion system protein PtlA